MESDTLLIIILRPQHSRTPEEAQVKGENSYKSLTELQFFFVYSVSTKGHSNVWLASLGQLKNEVSLPLVL